MMHRKKSKARQSRRGARGSILLEGLLATVLLMLGLVGVLQATIFASQQNASANKRLRAAAVASQVRAAMQSQGYGNLTATGNLLNQACASATSVKDLAGELKDQQVNSVNGCVVDLDALEAAPPSGYIKVQPGYDSHDAALYRRVAIWWTAGDVRSVGIVVSWMEMGRRRFVQQFVGIANPAANQSGIEL